MNALDHQYQSLLSDIIQNGTKKTTRNAETIAVFGRQIRHKMSDGFPLLTTKKMAWKQIVTELLWFLRGDTNIKFLLDYDCHIWDGDAYKNYAAKTSLDADGQFTKEEFIQQIKTDPQFAKVWGELGPIYGKQWRDLGGYEETQLTNKRNEKGYLVYEKKHHKGIDQIGNLIKELKENPDSRRMMVNAWNVKELGDMTLPPCHYGFQVYTRELTHHERINLCLSNRPESKFAAHIDTNEILMNDWGIPKRAISLMWNQRSVDTFLGLPFNIASYGLLLEIIAKEVGMVPDELIGNLGDTHLYVEHIDAAKEQIGRTPYELPKLGKDYREGEYNKNLTDFTPDDFYLIDYKSHPTIKAKLFN